MKGESTQKLLNDDDNDSDDGDDEILLAAGNSVRANVLWVWKCPNLFIQKDIWKNPQTAVQFHLTQELSNLMGKIK